MGKKILNSILVKPSGPDCNMACRYCFYHEKMNMFPAGTPHRMSRDVLEEMIRQFLQSAGQQSSIGWQGGEPTLMGLDFFQTAVDLEQRYGRGQVMGNGMQTNGILLDREWAVFLRKYNFLVGLSLDGPGHVHDHYRVTVGGRGTFQKVSDTAKLLLDCGVAVNALSVVNDYSVRHAHEIYEFLRDAGLAHMQFIPCVETGGAGVTDFSVKPRDYGAFLCAVFDRWIADFRDGVPSTSVRFFDSLFYRYVDMTPPDCTLLGECGTYVVVEHNGNVYSCDFFVQEQWLLGNVTKDSLDSMLNSPLQLEFGRMKSALDEGCRACPWQSLCRGGCTKDRIGSAHEFNRNYLCEAWMMFFQHADPVFRKLARDWKEQRSREMEQDAVRRLATAGTASGRNDPCPCGSGLKYKKCCGKI